MFFIVLLLYAGSRYGRYRKGKRKTRVGYDKKNDERMHIATCFLSFGHHVERVAMACIFYFRAFVFVVGSESQGRMLSLASIFFSYLSLVLR